MSGRTGVRRPGAAPGATARSASAGPSRCGAGRVRAALPAPGRKSAGPAVLPPGRGDAGGVGRGERGCGGVNGRVRARVVGKARG